MSHDMLLAPDEVQRLVGICVRLEVNASRRPVLIGGLPAEVRAQLPQKERPSDQVQSDIQLLNQRADACGADRAPLVLWLTNLSAMAFNSEDVAFIQHLSSRIAQPLSSPRSLPASPETPTGRTSHDLTKDAHVAVGPRRLEGRRPWSRTLRVGLPVLTLIAIVAVTGVMGRWGGTPEPAATAGGELRDHLSAADLRRLRAIAAQLADVLLHAPLEPERFDAWGAAQASLALDGRGRTKALLDFVAVERRPGDGWHRIASGLEGGLEAEERPAHIAASAWSVFALVRFGRSFRDATREGLLNHQHADKGYWPLYPDAVGSEKPGDEASNYATAWSVIALANARTFSARPDGHAAPDAGDASDLNDHIKAGCDWLVSANKSATTLLADYPDRTERAKRLVGVTATVALALHVACDETSRAISRLGTVLDSGAALGSSEHSSMTLKSRPSVGYMLSDNTAYYPLAWTLVLGAVLWPELDAAERERVLAAVSRAIAMLPEHVAEHAGRQYLLSELLLALDVVDGSRTFSKR